MQCFSAEVSGAAFAAQCFLQNGTCKVVASFHILHLSLSGFTGISQGFLSKQVWKPSDILLPFPIVKE